MINNITIDGISYKLIGNPIVSSVPCENCDIFLFCRKHYDFIRLCQDVNNNDYYKTVKQ